MAEFPALPLFTDAYLGDTTHLTTFEHGAYLLLLIVSWRSSECRLPDDDNLLARYTKMTRDKWRKIRPVIEPFFTVRDGFWHQARLQDELQHLRSQKEQQSKAGKASAAAKSLKRANRNSTNVDAALQRGVNGKSTPTPTPTIPLDKESNGAEALDSDRIMWANAKAFIAPEAKGDPGKLIGAWCRDYGKDATAQAITKAQLERPAQRIPFIIGCLKFAKQDGGLRVPC